MIINETENCIREDTRKPRRSRRGRGQISLYGRGCNRVSIQIDYNTYVKFYVYPDSFKIGSY